MTEASRLLLVGCGHLGSAMLRQWLTAGTVSNIHVVKPSALADEFLQAKNVSWSATPTQPAVQFNPDIIVLAVRPPSLDAILPSYAEFKNSLFLSVIAGKSLHQLETLLGSSSHAIIRAMPNVASDIGQGMTFGVANSHVNDKQRQLAEKLLSAIGVVAWMENENGFDVGTAISGCGPAYVFALTEAMEAAGQKLGLPKPLAAQLARQTVIGSGAVLARSTESASALRDAIGSPGTMTEAALKVLLAEGGLRDQMLEAITVATHHAKKLAR